MIISCKFEVEEHSCENWFFVKICVTSSNIISTLNKQFVVIFSWTAALNYKVTSINLSLYSSWIKTIYLVFFKVIIYWEKTLLKFNPRIKLVCVLLRNSFFLSINVVVLQFKLHTFLRLYTDAYKLNNAHELSLFCMSLTVVYQKT